MATSRICSIPDCDKIVHAHGWCVAHYTRFRRHGSPEGGGISKGAALEWLVAHVDFQGDDCLTWPFGRNAGRGSIHYQGRNTLAPRIMCVLAHGPAPTPFHEAAHSCGKGHEGCVNQKHLNWKTHKENMADRVVHGTLLQGEQTHNAILTTEQVREIRQIGRSLSGRELATQYGVSQATISYIRSGQHWKWL